MLPAFINPVCWTLSFEVLFYVIFAFLILNRRLGLILILGWAIGVVVNHIPGVHINFVLHHAFHKYTVLFMIGLLAAHVALRLRETDLNSISGQWLWSDYVSPARKMEASKPPNGLEIDRAREIKDAMNEKLAYAASLSGLLVFFLTAYYCVTEGISDWDLWTVTLGFGIAGGLLMLSTLSKKLDAFFKKRKILASIGDASYSIYLLHYPVAFVLVLYLQKHFQTHNQVMVNASFLAVCALTCLAGWFFYQKIERPLLRLARVRFLAPQSSLCRS